MQVLNFADFVRRRTDRSDVSVQQNAALPAVVTDRWAMLHSQTSEEPAADRDFFADLQLRLAYPTYPFRHH